LVLRVCQGPPEGQALGNHGEDHGYVQQGARDCLIEVFPVLHYDLMSTFF
jgi:hypothetical protein